MKPEMIDPKKESISAAMEVGISEIDGKEALVVKGLMDDDKYHYTFIPPYLFSELADGLVSAKEMLQEIKKALN